MDNFSIIYKILKTLEKAMDYDEFDIKSIYASTLGISENRWTAIMEMLIENGYIAGASANSYLSGKKIVISDIHITLKGLEYLQENSFMKKACNIAKGIVDAVI